MYTIKWTGLEPKEGGWSPPSDTLCAVPDHSGQHVAGHRGHLGGSMELARYVVDAVVLEGRGVREVARSHGVSKSWASELVRRYRDGGHEALEPRSRRAHSRTSDAVEDEIVRIRKDLVEGGFDAGPRTIHWHLAEDDVPSISTIWRILARRGFIEPEPRKRPVVAD